MQCDTLPLTSSSPLPPFLLSVIALRVSSAQETQAARGWRGREEPRRPGAGGWEFRQIVAKILRGPQMPADRHKWAEAEKKHKMWQRDAKTQRSNRGRWKETQIDRDREMTEIGGNRDTETGPERLLQERAGQKRWLSYRVEVGVCPG